MDKIYMDTNDIKLLLEIHHWAIWGLYRALKHNWAMNGLVCFTNFEKNYGERDYILKNM